MKIGRIFLCFCFCFRFFYMSNNLEFHPGPHECYDVQTLKNADVQVLGCCQPSQVQTESSVSPFMSGKFSSLVWVCFTHVQLRDEPENSMGSLTELEDPLFQLSRLQLSSFILPRPGAPFLISLTRKVGVSVRVLVCTTATASCLCLALKAILPGKQPGHSSLPSLLQLLAFHHNLSFFTFQKPQVVVLLYFDKFFILISRREIVQYAYGTMLNLELVICSFSDF